VRAVLPQRVVFTSSATAILPSEPPADVSRVWDEDKWNLDNSVPNHENAYIPKY